MAKRIQYKQKPGQVKENWRKAGKGGRAGGSWVLGPGLWRVFPRPDRVSWLRLGDLGREGFRGDILEGKAFGELDLDFQAMAPGGKAAGVDQGFEAV